MVVVHMRDDHGVDAVGINANRSQSITRFAQDGPIPLRPLRAVVTRVHDNGAAGGLKHPNEIVDGMRAGVVVIQDEGILARAAGPIGVLYSRYLPCFVHVRLPCPLKPTPCSDQTMSQRILQPPYPWFPHRTP